MAAECTLSEQTLLGSGTFGQVYKVLWKDNETKDGGEKENIYVAKKRVEKNQDGIDQSAVRECHFLTQYSHPYIIKPLRIVISRHGTVDIYMPLAETTLFYWMKNKTFEQRFEMVQILLPRMIDALKTVHNGNSLHRDIKPSNILLDEKGMPILADFGSARPIWIKGGDISQTKDMVTYMYRPPECSTSQYDASVDIYSLGCTCIHILAGIVPKPINDKDQEPPTPADWLMILQNKVKTKFDHFILHEMCDILITMINREAHKRPTAEQLWNELKMNKDLHMNQLVSLNNSGTDTNKKLRLLEQVTTSNKDKNVGMKEEENLQKHCSYEDDTEIKNINNSSKSSAVSPLHLSSSSLSSSPSNNVIYSREILIDFLDEFVCGLQNSRVDDKIIAEKTMKNICVFLDKEKNGYSLDVLTYHCVAVSIYLLVYKLMSESYPFVDEMAGYAQVTTENVLETQAYVFALLGFHLI